MEHWRTKTLVVGILAESKIFSDDDNDEFVLELNGTKRGIFKKYEYLSLPFSLLGKRSQFEELLHQTLKENISFKQELELHPEAKEVINGVFARMKEQPAFSRQSLDHALAEIYVKDVALSTLRTDPGIDSQLAKIALCWEKMADFYCIEALVGGQGKINPFENDGPSSLIAGALDCFESTLPSIRKSLIISGEVREWQKVCLMTSSILGRSYHQIDEGIKTLEHLFGTKDISKLELQESIDLLGRFIETRFETNKELGKLYNSLIRFHNWMPLAICKNDSNGSTYDSICSPTNVALSKVNNSEIISTLEKIKGATSPKGIALLTLAEDGKIGNICNIKNIQNSLEQEFNTFWERDDKHAFFDLEDNAFYSGLTGGKWKGIKLLYDAKEALGLSYKVPKGFVLSTLTIARALEKSGVQSLLQENIFYLNESRRKEVEQNIHSDLDLDLIVEKILEKSKTNGLGADLILRSSMYGEDGGSNFSGTYESIQCKAHFEEVDDALKGVIKSYFGVEAVRCREDVGLAHLPGIAVIAQERISGKGGVIYLTREGYILSLADNPEEAVKGNGSYHKSSNLPELLKGTPLYSIESDLQQLQDVFGDIDVEFVISNQGEIYLTQLRAKYQPPVRQDIDTCLPRVSIISENIANIIISEKCILRVEDLGQSFSGKEEDLMNFIRKNKKYLIAVEGRMPTVAHVPNKIEGHFGIQYIKID